MRWQRGDDRWSRYRLPVGRHARTGALEWTEPFPAVVAVRGRTSSGGPDGLAMAALDAWPGPVLCLSTGHALAEAVTASRARRGRIWSVDLAGLHPGDRLDLLPADLTYSRSQLLAEIFTAPFAHGDVKDGAFWSTTAASLLAAVLLAVSRDPGPAPARRVVTLLSRQESHEVVALLNEVGGADGKDALGDYKAHLDLAEQTRSGVEAVARAAVAAFRQDGVRAALGRGGCTPQELLSGSHTTFVTAPVSGRASLAALTTAVASVVVNAAEGRAERTGDPSRLLVIVDGAGSVAHLPALPTWAVTLTESGTSLLVSFALLEQLHVAHGDDQTGALVSAASAVVLGRSSSPRAAALLDDWAGADIDGLPLAIGRQRLRLVKPGQAVVLRPEQEPTLVRLLTPAVDPDLGWSLGHG